MKTYRLLIYSCIITLFPCGCSNNNYLFISHDKSIRVYEFHGSCYFQIKNEVYNVSIKTNNPTEYIFRVCISLDGGSDNYEFISTSTLGAASVEMIMFNSSWIPIKYEEIDSTATILPAIMSILKYYSVRGHVADSTYHTIIFERAAGDTPWFIHIWLDADGQCWEWISLGSLFKVSCQNIGGESVIIRIPQGSTKPGVVTTRKLGQEYISEIQSSVSVFYMIKPIIEKSVPGTIGYDVDKAIFEYYENDR